MSQTPTAQALKQAREQRALAKKNYDEIAVRLGTAEWNEEQDGPSLDKEKRSWDAAQALVDRLTDKLTMEGSADSDGEQPITANYIAKRTRDSDLPKMFSLHRAIRMTYGITDERGNTEKRDGVENEMIQEGKVEARSAGIIELSPDGFVVPAMCSYGARTQNPRKEQRDMVVGTTTAGGHLVATDLGELIPFLDPDTPLAMLGARRLTDLVGNLDLPRHSARSTGYALGEQTAITESTPGLQKLSLAPKRQGAYVESSLQLIRQSSVSVENMTREDLRAVLMQLQEQYAIAGTGTSNQPTGITATSGIGSVAGGTNGAIPTWGNVVGLETAVANANALKGKPGYLTTPGIVGQFKQVKRDVAGNNFIFESQNGVGWVNGYRAAASTLVPSTLTKGTSSGVCHAIIFGNFQELIMAYWGGIEIIYNPYSLDTTGSVRITANAFFDVGVRHAASFAAMLDALAS